MIECQVYGLPDIGEGQLIRWHAEDSFDNDILDIAEVGRHELRRFSASLSDRHCDNGMPGSEACIVGRVFLRLVGLFTE